MHPQRWVNVGCRLESRLQTREKGQQMATVREVKWFPLHSVHPDEDEATSTCGYNGTAIVN